MWQVSLNEFYIDMFIIWQWVLCCCLTCSSIFTKTGNSNWTKTFNPNRQERQVKNEQKNLLRFSRAEFLWIWLNSTKQENKIEWVSDKIGTSSRNNNDMIAHWQQRASNTWKHHFLHVLQGFIWRLLPSFTILFSYFLYNNKTVLPMQCHSWLVHDELWN